VIDNTHAIWTQEPHFTDFWTVTYGHIRRAVNDPVLIWFSNPITYRLEGKLTLDEAKQIVQSLK
jgi:hypothetical protein